MSILFGLLLARRFYCRSALSLSPGRTGGLLPRINAPTKSQKRLEISVFGLILLCKGLHCRDFIIASTFNHY